MEDQRLRVALGNLTPDHIKKFSFSDTHCCMQEDAPNLMSLFDDLVNISDRQTETDPPNISDPAATEKRVRKRHRREVMAASILANQTSQRFNLLQGIITYTLYSFKVPKRVITILNHLGVCVSYPSLLVALRNNAKVILSNLRNICTHGEAILISFDNLNRANNVRDQRVFNEGSFTTSTAGYVVRPHQRYPMLTELDRRYQDVEDLTVRDFLPSLHDQSHMQLAFASCIFSTLKSFAHHHSIIMPAMTFPMPQIYPLDAEICNEITSLRVYDLNEAVINDMIQILYKIESDIGLTAQQRQHNVLSFRGDFLTVRQDRYLD